MTVKNEKSDDGKRNEGDINKEAVDYSTNGGLWGSDLYPERKGAKQKGSWFNRLIGAAGRESIDRARCEDNVYKCIKDSTISLIYAQG